MMTCGLIISQSALVPDGTWVIKRGREVIGVRGKERRDFWKMFGFAEDLPAGTTELVVSTTDYAAFRAAIPHGAERLPPSGISFSGELTPADAEEWQRFYDELAMGADGSSREEKR